MNKTITILGIMMIALMSMTMAVTLTVGDTLDVQTHTLNTDNDITFTGTTLTGSFGFHSANAGYTSDGQCPSSGSSPLSLAGVDSFCFTSSENELSYLIFVDNFNSGVSVDLLETAPPSNTAPVINSISPNEYTELTQGESQIFSASVTDTEDDANYTWTLGGIEVSTTETYTAVWEDIASGVYTLELEVNDGEFSDTVTTTLEIRARGGSGSGGSSFSTLDTRTGVPAPIENPEEEDVIQPQQQNRTREAIQNFFESIGDFFRNLFGGN